MRLIEVTLNNFRSYVQETRIELDPFTVLLGRNDAGKSSIFDALDIFFNDAPIENDDCSVGSTRTEVRIGCVFGNLPPQLVIDEQYPTNLTDEHLLRPDEKLEIVKVYSCSSAKGKLSNIFAIASHPSSSGVDDLLGLKISELRSRAQQRQVDLTNCNQSIKAQLRQAIWAQADSLSFSTREVSLTKESGKEVWEQLQQQFPIFALFKSDRASTDQDAEAQDPLKAAIKEAVRRREVDLNGVIAEIQQELASVASRTVDKIREMNPELANQLRPEIKNKSWDSLFAVTLTGEDQIPINKRGSGTRRLVLLNFFRAKAEEESDARDAGIIYAIEEPETSQHPNHQIMLLDAFQDLVAQDRCQIMVTTHTPTLARRVDRRALRLITAQNGGPLIEKGNSEATLEKIKNTLGVLPDHDIKAFLGVEGRHDINFLKRISCILAGDEPDIPDLSSMEQSGRLVFIPLGGSSLDLWVTTLAGLKRPEFYLTDRDLPPPVQPRYQQQIEEWRERGCTAWVTSKRELENYLHPSVIMAEVSGYPGTASDFEDIPLLFAQAVHTAAPGVSAWATISDEKRKHKISIAKKRLNTVCVERMTPELLTQSDPNNDIRTWLRAIGQALNH